MNKKVKMLLLTAKLRTSSVNLSASGTKLLSLVVQQQRLVFICQMAAW